MIILDNMKKCTGCEACANICPVSCISMVKSNEGFLYPKIDDTLCIECGVCRKTCPVNIITTADTQKIEAYACMSLDDGIRSKSSSGGVFKLLSEQIIERAGVVFGAYIDGDFFVRHGWSDSIVGIEKFLKSKYVQSYIGNSYKEAKEFLNADRSVLFSGTPCQIAGLKQYLGKEFDKLICVDVVCFGVPSPFVFEKYIKALELLKNSKVIGFDFRNKEKGWTGKKFSIKIEFENGEVINEFVTSNLYHKAFFNGCNVRLSCYNCAYKNGHRVSDLTLADYWGVEKYTPDMDDGKGTTLVMINNRKGEVNFRSIKKNSNSKKISIETAFIDNQAAVHSKSINSNRNSFFKEIEKDKEAERTLRILQKYTKVSFLKRGILSIKRRLYRVFHIRKAEM